MLALGDGGLHFEHWPLILQETNAIELTDTMDSDFAALTLFDLACLCFTT